MEGGGAGKGAEGAAAREGRAGEDVGAARHVDTMLVALQKTFSRVSRSSAGVAPDEARALIVGNVEFEMTVRCRMDDEQRRLVIDEAEGAPLRLKGVISTDFAVREAGGAGGAADGPGDSGEGEVGDAGRS